MIELNIPGKGELQLDNLMLDFNGTLACDGEVLDGVKERIEALSEKYNVVVVTGDSHGTAKEQLKSFKCAVHVIGPEEQGQQKLKFLRSLGDSVTACIGNGMNDKYVLQAAALGVIVCLQEGAAAASVTNADIVCRDILDALDLFLNPLRIVTTLRT